jgi:hypothetical protein
MVQPFTVTVLADAVAPGPPPVDVELDTEPPPAWTRTDEPPAEDEEERPPDVEALLLPPPADAPAVVIEPSALRLTVTVQVCPVALVPCFTTVSA